MILRLFLFWLIEWAKAFGCCLLYFCSILFVLINCQNNLVCLLSEGLANAGEDSLETNDDHWVQVVSNESLPARAIQFDCAAATWRIAASADANSKSHNDHLMCFYAKFKKKLFEFALI